MTPALWSAESPRKAQRGPLESARWARMMPEMKTTDSPGDLSGGFEPAPGPGVPTPRVTPSHPRLCEAGPCINYHRLEVQVEAADPMARKVPVRLPVLKPGMVEVVDGTLYQGPAVFHTAVSHYCYPSPGIEMPLGAVPVVQCNRWRPGERASNGDVLPWDFSSNGPGDFWQSREGKRYIAELTAWQEARERAVADDQEAERLIAEGMAAAQDTNSDEGER